MNYDKYRNIFFPSDKYHDAFQRCLRLVPFITNASQSIYDKSCGVTGVTGECFRHWSGSGSKIVAGKFDRDVIDPVRAYLKDKMSDREAAAGFESIVSDVMKIGDDFNVIDTSFFKYVPPATISEQGKRLNQKYERGQKRIAEYICSMAGSRSAEAIRALNEPDNLFCRIIRDALESVPGADTGGVDDNDGYYVIPRIKDQFDRDLSWLLKRRNNITVRYVPLLLHFYACFSLMQVIPRLNLKKEWWKDDKPLEYYYMLSSEHASAKSEAVLNGWSEYMDEEDLSLIFGRVQCLDILNILLDGPVGLYPEIFARLHRAEDFEYQKEALEELLEVYQAEKRKVLESRQNAEKSKAKELIDTRVESYDEFVEKLYQLCTNNHPADYKSKFKKSVLDLMRVKLLENRRGYWVLTLDDEMLLFMIALVTREKRTKVDDMYKKFTDDYGIRFNMATRNLIEKYLLKLNLLDRKSDSGEAQYVEFVL